MIKTILTVCFITLALAGCKSEQEGAANCLLVMQELDQCAEHGAAQLACSDAITAIKASLGKTSINDFNRAMWVLNCRGLCKGDYAYQSTERRNFEVNCINSEVFTVRDERFLKLSGLSGLFVICCLVLLYVLRSLFRIQRLRRSAVRTNGIIVGHDTTHSDGSTLYAPIIEFKDWMGQPHTFTTRVYSSRMGKPRAEVNSQVKVIYPKDKPGEARYDSFLSLWFAPLTMLLFAGIFFALAALGLFAEKEWRGHHRYLQQHAPALAETVDGLRHALFDSIPLLTAMGDFRVLEEQPDAILLEVDYRLSPFQEGKMYMGAITLTNGQSGGEWAYRPARLKKGLGTAQVRLSMNSTAPERYCSNQVQISIYAAGQSNTYKRVIPYEKCWTKTQAATD